MRPDGVPPSRIIVPIPEPSFAQYFMYLMFVCFMPICALPTRARELRYGFFDRRLVPRAVPDE